MAAKSGMPALACLPMAMLLGMGFSMINGGVSLVARIHPIIVTLAAFGWGVLPRKATRSA